MKTAAARALDNLARFYEAGCLMIAAAGGVPLLVQLLRDGSAEAKAQAARALGWLARKHNVLIAEAGGIARLLDLVRDGSAEAKRWAAVALRRLAEKGLHAVAIAAAVGFDALVQLARSGDVTVDNESIVRYASVPAKRKAALVVADLLRDYVPEFNSVPDVLMAAIVSYL